MYNLNLYISRHLSNKNNQPASLEPILKMPDCSVTSIFLMLLLTKFDRVTVNDLQLRSVTQQNRGKLRFSIECRKTKTKLITYQLDC